jgi:hypothetical protein
MSLSASGLNGWTALAGIDAWEAEARGSNAKPARWQTASRASWVPRITSSLDV